MVPTPFDNDLQLDHGSLGRLVRRYTSAGVTGLVVLGVFGEASALSVSERAAVLATVAAAVDLPLIVGMTSLATAPLLDEVRAAKQALGSRLAGVMVQVNSASTNVVSAHLGAVAAAAGVGIVVQDYPGASGVKITADALRLVLDTTPGIVGVKAESPPTALTVSTLAGSGVPIFGGLGGVGLLDELACGSAGSMTGFSFPEAMVACVRAYRRGGYSEAHKAFSPYLPLVNFEMQAKYAIATRKGCLHARGWIDSGAVRPPVSPLPAALALPLNQHVEFMSSVLNALEESPLPGKQP